VNIDDLAREAIAGLETKERAAEQAALDSFESARNRIDSILRSIVLPGLRKAEFVFKGCGYSARCDIKTEVRAETDQERLVSVSLSISADKGTDITGQSFRIGVNPEMLVHGGTRLSVLRIDMYRQHGVHAMFSEIPLSEVTEELFAEKVALFFKKVLAK